MWTKAKSTGSLLIQRIGSAVGSSDHSADDIWRQRLEKRFQTGHFGITLMTVLPKELIPVSWQRQMIVKQVQDTLSIISLDKRIESSEDLLRCSTVGLLDPSSMYLVAESLQTPRPSPEDQTKHVSFEEFVRSDQLLFGDQVLLEDLDLELSEFYLEETATPVNDEGDEEDKPGFLSTEDLKRDLKKWKGEQFEVTDHIAESAVDVDQTDVTTGACVGDNEPADNTLTRNFTKSSSDAAVDFQQTDDTTGECGDNKEPSEQISTRKLACSDISAKSTSHSAVDVGQTEGTTAICAEFKRPLEKTSTGSGTTSEGLTSTSYCAIDVCATGECDKEPEKTSTKDVTYSVCSTKSASSVKSLDNGDLRLEDMEQEDINVDKFKTDTSSNGSEVHKESHVSDDTTENLNNSGKGNVVKRFVNKVSPEILNSNNHADKNKSTDQKKKFVGVQNMTYQAAGTSLDSIQTTETSPVYNRSSTATSTSTEKANLQLRKEQSYVTRGEGFRQYRLFSEIEKAVNIKRLEEMKKKLLEDFRWRQTIVDELLEVAKGYYQNPLGPCRNRWKELRREIDQHSMHSITDTRAKLAAVTQFYPFFTCIIMMIQILFLGIVIALDGLATIDVASSLQLQENTRTFLGTETVDTWGKVNMWVGPTSNTLISMGAILGICMRDDNSLYMHGVTQNYSIASTLGCCEIAARNTAGTTTPEECHTLTRGIGQWRDVTCNQRQPGDNNVQHVLKPCCVDYTGSCSLLSNEHCTFLGGIFHETDKEHCSQVNCASGICKMGGMTSSSSKPWLSTSYQWWRPLVSIVYSRGVVHLLLVVAGEWLLLQQVERSAGWLRVAVIYILCGVAGGLCASVFSPYTPQVGTSAAVIGSLGVVHMELIEGWKLISKPSLELTKIYSLLLFVVFTGTLPHISNAAIITGFITGMLSAVTVLPYINLGLWGKVSRRIAMGGSLFLLLILFFFVVYSFHKVQSLYLCEGCRVFDCVEYTVNMCTHTMDTM